MDQAMTGDVEAALDTLRVGDLRAIGAGPGLLVSYHASMAGVRAVLKDEAKARAEIEDALRRLEAAEEDSRGYALADAAYAQALLGDGAAAAGNNARAIALAGRSSSGAFLLAYVGWNQAFAGDSEGARATIRQALEALNAADSSDAWLVQWTLGYAAIGQAAAGDAAAAATRERLRQYMTKAGANDDQVEAWMMLAWSYAQSGERARAAAIMAEQLANAYRTRDLSVKATALTCAAFALVSPLPIKR
jgi:LuxR family maltose regulon positive regulatory protein